MSQSAGLGVKINTFGPQRLDAEQGAWLVGMVEADGWFATNKNGIYVQYEMGLEQHKREMAMQNSQKDWLGVSRNVRIRKDRPDYVTLKIRAKADLINKIRPIFDKFQMIGAKKHQYRYFRTNQIEKNSIFFSDLDIAQRSLYKKNLTMHTATSKRTIEERLSRPLFDCWLVGFMNGEGCFSVYGATGEVNETISFSIGQTVDGFFLCTLVQHRLSLFDCSVYYVKSDNHYTIKTTSYRGVHSVQNFLNETSKNHNISFYGYKKVQFDNWVKAIRSNKCYNYSVIIFYQFFIHKMNKNHPNDIVRSFQ